MTISSWLWAGRVCFGLSKKTTYTKYCAKLQQYNGQSKIFEIFEVQLSKRSQSVHTSNGLHQIKIKQNESN